MASVTLKSTVEELQWLSDRLSAQARIIAVGVLAMAWGLLITPPESLRPISAKALLAVALVALLTLVADMLQYVAGYVSVKRRKDSLLRQGAEEGDGYDVREWRYDLRTSLFKAKIALAIIAFLALLAAVLPSLLIKA